MSLPSVALSSSRFRLADCKGDVPAESELSGLAGRSASGLLGGEYAGWFGARMCREGIPAAGKYVRNVALTARWRAGMWDFRRPVRS